MATYIIISIIAYLIGSINFSIIISKKIAGFDVREKGSGNAGATNVLRAVGIKAALLTLACDILKGVVSFDKHCNHYESEEYKEVMHIWQIHRSAPLDIKCSNYITERDKYIL